MTTSSQPPAVVVRKRKRKPESPELNTDSVNADQETTKLQSSTKKLRRKKRNNLSNPQQDNRLQNSPQNETSKPQVTAKDNDNIQPKQPEADTSPSKSVGANASPSTNTETKDPSSMTPEANSSDKIAVAKKAEAPSNAPKEENEENEENEKAKEDDPEVIAERLKRTVFVGNVSKDADRKAIKKLFKPFGKVESVRLRNAIPVNPKIDRKKAFLSNQLASFVDSLSAYVVFSSAEDIGAIMEKAIAEVNMTIFMEKHLRVSYASDTKENKGRHSAFVGNLPFDCQDEEMIQTFLPVAEKVGAKLLNVRVNRDKDTGVCRGIGFATFDDEMAVQTCINMSGEIKLRKNILRISKASKIQNRLSTTHKRNAKAAALNDKKDSFKKKKKKGQPGKHSKQKGGGKKR